jgi:hypothetical protein
MEQKLTKVFQKANYQSDANLSQDIWYFLLKREKRIAKLKLTAFSFVGILSLVGAIPAFKMLATDFAQSGFYEYFSLLFSSNGALASSWKELAYSLAESLPTISIILSLSVVFVFFLSIRYVLKQIIKGQLSLSFNV